MPVNLVPAEEIGIRMAIGAKPSKILSMIIAKGLMLVLAGIVLGVALSLGLSRFIQSTVWGISSTDPLAYVLASSAILCVSLVASLVPAHRAASVDPVVSLRSE